MNTQKIFLNSRVLCFLGLLLLLTPGMANSAVFTVNSTADAVAANPAGGVCETAAGNGICTLRAAIQVANASAATADTINVPPGTYTLTIAGLGENAAATGDLDITGVLAANALTIGGTGLTPAATIIDGGRDRQGLRHHRGCSCDHLEPDDPERQPGGGGQRGSHRHGRRRQIAVHDQCRHHRQHRRR